MAPRRFASGALWAWLFLSGGFLFPLRIDFLGQLAAFDPEWNAAVPYTLLIRPDGSVAYRVQSTNVDPLKLKRLIIANLADDDYIGHQAYWKTAIEAKK